MPTVRVAIRSRPESAEQSMKDFSMQGQTGSLHLSVGGQRHEFTFDHLFGSSATQEDIFNTCAVPICKDVLDGFNGSIFAYGQTGAGKTHTMSGPVDVEDYDKDRGLCMRVSSYLFANARKLPDTVSIRLSIMEIYNEQLIDLLREPVAASTINAPAIPKLSIVEVPGQGVLIPALYVMPLASEEDAFTFFLMAHRNRSVAEHQLNRNSSRSHVVYTFYIDRVRAGGAVVVPDGRQHARKSMGGQVGTNAPADVDPEVIQSKVHLVDLAGSERTGKTGSSGVVQKEATYINRSLSYLEQVVVALTQQKREHIPYRQSKLTHLLKDSLGGNCNTCLVACVWPHVAHDWETLSTLRFSARMKNIENTPVRNSLSTKEPASAALVKQINQLKRELIMRDHITGVEAYLPTLTFTQKAWVADQASELVLGGGPASDGSVDPRKKESPFSLPEDLEIRSVSHMQQLVGTLRAAIWEACDGDAALVSEVMQRTSERLRSSQLGTVASNGGRALLAPHATNALAEPLPRKEAWIYPSNYEGDEVLSPAAPGNNRNSIGVLELPPLQSDGKFAAHRLSGSKVSLLSAQSARSEAPPASNAAATVYPAEGTDPTNPKAFVLPAAWVAPTGNKSQAQVFSDAADEDTPAFSSSGEDTAAQFEAFKAGAGKVLHDAYEDIRRTVHVEKARQREVASLLNRRKAEIDELQSSLAVYLEEEAELRRKQQLSAQQSSDPAPQLEENGIADSDSSKVVAAATLSDKSTEQLTGLTSVISGMRIRLDEAKTGYRAAHMELQLCKKQLTETQILKKRAMNSVLSAFEKGSSTASHKDLAVLSNS